jgi:hypothetical protein
MIKTSPFKVKFYHVIFDIYSGVTLLIAFSLIIEGATEKVLNIIMPLWLINNRNFGFIE